MTKIVLHPSQTLGIMAEGWSKMQQLGKFTYKKIPPNKSKERGERGQDMRPYFNVV